MLVFFWHFTPKLTAGENSPAVRRSAHLHRLVAGSAARRVSSKKSQRRSWNFLPDREEGGRGGGGRCCWILLLLQHIQIFLCMSVIIQIPHCFNVKLLHFILLITVRSKSLILSHKPGISGGLDVCGAGQLKRVPYRPPYFVLSTIGASRRAFWCHFLWLATTGGGWYNGPGANKCMAKSIVSEDRQHCLFSYSLYQQG